jgi:integrase
MIKPHYDKKRKAWRVDYSYCGQYKRRWFKIKEIACEFSLQKTEVQKRAKVGLPVKMMPMKDALDQFRDTYFATVSTSYRVTEQRRIKHIQKYFEEDSLDTVSFARLESFKMKRMEDKVSNQTLKHDFVILKTFFGWCVKNKWIGNNPVDEINFRQWFPHKPRKVRNAIDLVVVDKILSNACACCYPALVIAFNFGLRRAELCYIEKSHFVRTANYPMVLRIPHTEETPFKNKSGVNLPVPIGIIPLIDSLGQGPIVRFHPNTLYKHFKRILKKCGLDPKIDLHSIRHTFATNVAKTPGMPDRIGMQLTRHLTPAIYRRYHHFNEGDLKLIEKVQNFLPLQPLQENPVKVLSGFNNVDQDKTTPTPPMGSNSKDLIGFDKRETGFEYETPIDRLLKSFVKNKEV